MDIVANLNAKSFAPLTMTINVVKLALELYIVLHLADLNALWVLAY